ncbi:MAG: cytochrome b/b6 domain-containing protein [Chryseolinea sp.]
MTSTLNSKSNNTRHKRWVKVSHWIITVSFLLLAFTGIEILMVHPRLYWGEVGNDLTPALFELPISRNYQHGGWEKSGPFFAEANSPVSASRTYDIFNKNGWGRSLHFLSAWFFVVTGVLYLVAGFFTRHFRNNLIPKSQEFSLRLFWQDFIHHLRMQIPFTPNGPKYGLLQKSTYLAVIFLLLPLIIITGLTMSPAIAAAFPFLLNIFGGMQSARTIHFFTSIALELFLFVHVVMVIKSGFKQQIRAMTIDQ